MRIVSSFTPDNGYPEDAKLLRASLDRLGIPAEIEEVPSVGNWKANCMARASFLLGKLRGSGESILWIDADAAVRSDPRPYLDALKDVDVGFHFLNGKELLGGTQYYRPTADAMLLLERWVFSNGVYSAAPRSQVNLRRAVDSISSLRVARLPAAFTFIFDTMRKMHPDVVPIIEHFQASRRVRGFPRPAIRRADA